MKKIVLAGGSGFIGQEIIRQWGKHNQLIILTRQLPNAKNNRNQYSALSPEDLKNTTWLPWDAQHIGDWAAALDGADWLINLAGKSVNCRYTEKNKKEIIDSRVHAVNVLGAALRQCNKPPPLWINAASATIYRQAMDKPQDEYSGEMGSGFSVEVCKLWEKTFFEQPTPATRKIGLRLAITLGSGGVLIPYFNLVKWGLGGKQGSGKQLFSWVHIADLCRIIEWLAADNKLSGSFNCSSPNPVTNQEFMKTLRKTCGHITGLPTPAWMMKLGAAIIGTEAELVLKSRWVLPARLIELGFQFSYPTISKAFENIVAQTPKKQYKLF